jgi:hypothetical protein
MQLTIQTPSMVILSHDNIFTTTLKKTLHLAVIKGTEKIREYSLNFIWAEFG